VTERDLAPRTVGELLDAAFFVYRRGFARLLLVTLLVSLPALVVAVLFADDAANALRSWWGVLTEGMHPKPGDDAFSAFRLSMQANAKIQGIAFLMGLLQAFERSAGVVTMSVVAAAALRREAFPSIGRVFRESLPRIPAAVLAQFVLDHIIGCFACCFPVAIVFQVLTCCTTAAIATERGSTEKSAHGAPAVVRWAVVPFAAAIDGAARSVKLTWNGPTIGRGTALLFILLMFVGIADGVAMGLGALLAGRSGGWFWAQHCAEALVLPAWGLGVCFWFADLRARREGADLEPVAT